MVTSFTQITPSVRLRRSQKLPVTGTVLVRLGQKVNVGDPLAEAIVPVHHELVDVVRALGLPGPKAAEKMIQRKAGETLGENDILAETGGIFSRIIRTPAPGKILSIREGQILIQTETQTITLAARYSGTVVEILSDRGAMIETSAAVIQGVWGNGKFAQAVLMMKSESPNSLLSSADLGITDRGTIIACSTLTDPAVLELAASLPVEGLIIGCMPAALREKALLQPYPIVLIEGFGNGRLNSDAHKLLAEYNSHEVIVNTQIDDSTDLLQPEIVIANPLEKEAPPANFRLTSGLKVRIHTAPFLGQTGVIEKVLPGLTTLPNGLRVYAASVIMDNKERKTIPINNLDSIGFTQNS
jgi:hypothetical protein